MRIRVLGSSAGGGLPQWNCGCRNCAGLRNGTVSATARTQASLAVSADGDAWFLLDASPDIPLQIERCWDLHPRRPRHSPITGILLTSGDLDHCLGLLALRESQPLVVWATETVRYGFTEGNPLYRTLQRFPRQVTWQVLKPGCAEPLAGPDGGPSGLTVQAVPVPGKPPLHLEAITAPHAEDCVGLRVRDTRTERVLAYLPGVAAMGPGVQEAIAGADCLFFDGTFWSSDELPAQGLGTARAEAMGHLPIGGPGGSLATLTGLDVPRRIYTHMNNTNPILRADSPERRQVVAHGWEVAWDGMEVVL